MVKILTQPEYSSLQTEPITNESLNCWNTVYNFNQAVPNNPIYLVDVLSLSVVSGDK